MQARREQQQERVSAYKNLINPATHVQHSFNLFLFNVVQLNVNVFEFDCFFFNISLWQHHKLKKT